MKKLFIVAGEASGDRLGAWYLTRLKKDNPEIICEAVGGDLLAKGGAKLFETIDNLSLTGIVEIIKHLPSVQRLLKRLVAHIVEGKFEEVVLVDFPGFNLVLARRLKKVAPHIKITYLSPPQLWVWGAWRIKKIRRNIDTVIVLYPFEVEWYQGRGVDAHWYGYPFYDKLSPFFASSKHKEKAIALLCGSRSSELKMFLPLLANVAKRFAARYPDVSFVIPVAHSMSVDRVKRVVEESGLFDMGCKIVFVQDEAEKYAALSSCALAITKPGTITLELAVLQVPSLIIYRCSPFSYFIGKHIVRVSYMGLPNLFLGKEVYKELLQGACREDKIFEEGCKIYDSFLTKNDEYQTILHTLSSIKHSLAGDILDS